MRLNPHDPLLPSMTMDQAIASPHFVAGRYDEAVTWPERALVKRRRNLAAIRLIAAGHALAGRQEQAQAATARAPAVYWRASRLLEPKP